MPIIKLQVEQLGKKQLSHMELQLLLAAKAAAAAGQDIRTVALLLEKELARWKSTHDRYKNAPTVIEARSPRELYLLNKNNGDLVRFKATM